jgi:hypothetical protein
VTTALDPTSTAGSFTDYVVKLAEDLAQRPEGAGLRLLMAPAEPSDRDGVVYVQGPTRDDGSFSTYPISVETLRDGDVLAATQRIDPADAEFVRAYLASGYYGRNDHCGKDALTQTHQYD